MKRILTTIFAILLIQSLVVTKVFSDEVKVKDCFETLNRATFALNMGLVPCFNSCIASVYFYGAYYCIFSNGT